MGVDLSRRPGAAEHLPYYAQYIQAVPDGEIVRTLARQLEETLGVLRAALRDRAGHRYAAGKWTVQQVVGHVADAERVFMYRALAFARGEQGDLPGFDENAYAEATASLPRSFDDVLADLMAVRHATLSLLRGLDEAAWARQGNANGAAISVRALAWVVAGHELHHRRILQERYLKA
jgi:uncharacterized damage-inducible protein DinB